MPHIGLSLGAGHIEGTAITIELTAGGATLHTDTGRLPQAQAELLAARCELMAREAQSQTPDPQGPETANPALALNEVFSQAVTDAQETAATAETAATSSKAADAEAKTGAEARAQAVLPSGAGKAGPETSDAQSLSQSQARAGAQDSAAPITPAAAAQNDAAPDETIAVKPDSAAKSSDAPRQSPADGAQPAAGEQARARTEQTAPQQTQPAPEPELEPEPEGTVEPSAARSASSADGEADAEADAARAVRDAQTARAEAVRSDDSRQQVRSTPDSSPASKDAAPQANADADKAQAKSAETAPAGKNAPEPTQGQSRSAETVADPAEAAASVPWLLYQGDAELGDHPLLALLARPNGAQGGGDLFELFYAQLQTAGNAYLEAVLLDGQVRELHALRPDRMSVLTDRAGWPSGYDYEAGGYKRRFTRDNSSGRCAVHHMRLFHPMSDGYGFSPLEAAAQAVDIHNEGGRWAKALLDNSARPSGALIYRGGEGAERLSDDAFDRLKSELEGQHSGARHAGRPMVLEGGLDWKAMSLTPNDMDFIEARREAAREIALAFGVPPMLLGIPGDNSYANYKQANQAFWRQTIIPLVTKTARGLEAWLQPFFGDDLRLSADLDAVPALSEERAALWKRLSEAGFLSDQERRTLAGLEAGA